MTGFDGANGQLGQSGREKSARDGGKTVTERQ
jgi:hypothetical protein